MSCFPPTAPRGRLLPLLFAVALVCVSCGGEPGTGGSREPRTDGDAGVLVAALPGDPGHLNPAITTAGGTHTASELLYNGLVELRGPDLEPEGELAVGWEVEEDGRVYRFRLREGVRWHDGAPLTSADVRFTFEELLLRHHSRTRASLGSLLEGIETPDAHSVVFRFREPYAPLLQQLGVTEAPILPRHVYGAGDPLRDPANRAPVGTGPFRFVSYRPDAEIVLDRNPDYFKPGLPRLDRVVLRVIPDPGSQVLALESGEVQWLFAAPGPDEARLRADPRFSTLETSVNPGGSNCIMTLAFNLERPPFRDLSVRKAVAHAIDRRLYLERIHFGRGRLAEAPISSGIPFAHAPGLRLPRHDPGEASRLLEASGWSSVDGGHRVARGVDGVEDGTGLSIDFVHFPTYALYGELLRDQLARVGFDVTLRSFEPAVFVEEVFRARDFDLAVVSYCNGTDPEIGVRRMYVSESIAPVPFSNAAAYRNPRIDSLFDEARSSLDRERRRALYREIQEIAVQDLPYLWMVETTALRVHDAGCTGFSAAGHFAERASCR